MPSGFLCPAARGSGKQGLAKRGKYVWAPSTGGLDWGSKVSGNLVQVV